MKYATIVADPPWAFTWKSSNDSHRVAPLRHYPTMELPDIGQLPIDDLAEKRAHLWLWCMNSNVPDAWWVAESWGFKPITMLTWCKPGPGVGIWFRTNTEHVLFCTRGKALPRQHVPLQTWFQWPRGAHSQKPEAFYDLVEQVSPAPRLELFARRQRIGWDTWGNESLEHVQIG